MFRPEIAKDFIIFLKENDILLEFNRNLKIGREKYDLLRLYRNPHHMITLAFEWHATKEGHHFWVEFHNKWYDIVVNKYDTDTFHTNELMRSIFG